MKKKTTEEFIKQAKGLYGDTYDYSTTEYTTCKNHVKIICKLHGEFYKLPNHHLHGSGCQKCIGFNLTTEDVIKEFQQQHGNYYDYSMVDYRDSNTKVSVVCPRHGVFQQCPKAHKRGSGCRECFNERLREDRAMSRKEFIQKAKDIHGTRYDYRDVDYINSLTPVRIKCHKHGTFLQIPNNHLRGSGCRSCARQEHWNPNSSYGLMGYYGTADPSSLYVLSIEGKYIKVGLAKDLAIRIRGIERDSGKSVEYIHAILGKANELFDLEQKILRHSGLQRYYPDVSFGGQSECLELSKLPKVLEIIENWKKEKDNE